MSDVGHRTTQSAPRFRVVTTSGYEVKNYEARQYASGYCESEILILDSANCFKVVKRKYVKTAAHSYNAAGELRDSRFARYLRKMQDEAAELEQKYQGGDADD